MKLRCPYCKHVFGPEPRSKCPKCGKTIIIPDNLRKVRFIDRKKARLKRERTLKREQAKRKNFSAVPFARQPRFVLGAAFLLVVVGTLLIQRTKEVYDPPSPEWEKILKDEMTATRHVNTLRAGLEAYNKDCIRYPTTEQGLRALYVNYGVPFWNGPYITMTIPDPWGTEYQYTNNNENIKIFSCGPDKMPNTEDDILPTDSEYKRMLKEREAGRIAR